MIEKEQFLQRIINIYIIYMPLFSRYREYDKLAELYMRKDMVGYYLAYQSGITPYYPRLSKKQAEILVSFYVHHVCNMDRDIVLYRWMGHHCYRCVSSTIKHLY